MFKNQNNYYKKYLKYKKKYLDFKKLIGGMEAADCKIMRIQVETNYGIKEVCVNKEDDIYTSIETAFGIGDNVSLEVNFGGNDVGPGDTFEDHGIEDGARLDATFGELSWFFIYELIRLNPELGRMSQEELFARIFGGDDYNNMTLSNLRLKELPPSINRFRLNGSLYLTDNNLRRLPEGFNNIAVAGSIFVERNPWEDDHRPINMPHNIISFCDVLHDILALNPELVIDDINRQYEEVNQKKLEVTISEDNPLNVTSSWDLNRPRIYRIPPSIGRVSIDGNFYLCHNPFTTLPVEFSNITAKKIFMHDNRSLTRLPNSIGNLTGCEELTLFDCPMLTTLPDGFMDINVNKIQIDYNLYRREQNRLNVHFELVNISYQRDASGERVPRFVELKRRN